VDLHGSDEEREAGPATYRTGRERDNSVSFSAWIVVPFTCKYFADTRRCSLLLVVVVGLTSEALFMMTLLLHDSELSTQSPGVILDVLEGLPESAKWLLLYELILGSIRTTTFFYQRDVALHRYLYKNLYFRSDAAALHGCVLCHMASLIITVMVTSDSAYG